MEGKKRRIFIKYLPELATTQNIESAFSHYGKVTGVEIKQRKDLLNQTDISGYFAYVNMEIDDKNLNKCFKEFSTNMWNGNMVELQLASESFLERLKREREESKETNNYEKLQSTTLKEDVLKTEQTELNNVNTKKDKKKLKNNTKQLSNNELSPISKIENLDIERKQIEEVSVNVNPSEMKRIHSVNRMIKAYQQQQMALKAAFNNVDMNMKNRKIIFDDICEVSDAPQVNKSIEEINKKKSIFDNEDDMEDTFNFELKSQFDGKNGQQLFELQSKYKNDKRFKLDERFAEDQDKEAKMTRTTTEVSLEEEKKNQINILKQVLDTNITSKNFNSGTNCSTKRVMLRFDPTQADHSKFEIKATINCNKKVKHDDNQEKDTYNIQETAVSKNIFYKVSDDLKNTFTTQQEFSVLNLFGHKSKKEECEETKEEILINKKDKLSLEANPFHYDSSEDELENLGSKNNTEIYNPKDTNVQCNTSTFWSEPLFFKDEDFRLQDGSDFVKRVASATDSEFIDQRRNLKHIVKAKARNCQRKNKPFKKKLGGNTRKKFIKIKKALKR